MYIYNWAKQGILFIKDILTGDGTFFKYAWEKQGILFIKDILTGDGTFLKFLYLKQHFKIKGTYLDYIRLQKNLPKAWRDQIKNKAIENTCLLTIPPILTSVKLLLKDPAGSKTIYNVLTQFKNYEPICIKRWDRLLPNENRHWLNIFGWSFKCTNNAQLNVFQYQLIHNILPANSFKKIGISQTDICRFCKTDVETILHVFLECQIISYVGRVFSLGLIIT